MLHRTAAHLLTQGYSQVEVAKHLEVTNATVTNWTQQRWFQALVSELLEARDKDALEILKAEAVPTAFKLIEMRDSPTTPASVKFNVAKEILERVYGKSTQFIVSQTTKIADPVAEAERLQAEAERLLKPSNS